MKISLETRQQAIDLLRSMQNPYTRITAWLTAPADAVALAHAAFGAVPLVGTVPDAIKLLESGWRPPAPVDDVREKALRLLNHALKQRIPLSAILTSGSEGKEYALLARAALREADRRMGDPSFIEKYTFARQILLEGWSPDEPEPAPEPKPTPTVAEFRKRLRAIGFLNALIMGMEHSVLSEDETALVDKALAEAKRQTSGYPIARQIQQAITLIDEGWPP